MKKIVVMIAMVLAMAINANALTYEEAFDAVKSLPDMQGVDDTLVAGDNDFSELGITDAHIIVWSGENETETAAYGNPIYKIIGELPVDEMVQGRMADGSLFAIFAKPVSENSNRIIILSDSARAGFTGALIGYINDSNLEALRNAILTSREGGGTGVYLKVLNF